jgi:hypothetical protein
MGVAMAAGMSGLAWADTTEMTSLDTVVRVEGVRTRGDEVEGRVVNETGDQLEDVRLMVSDQFLWRNERHPGEDSPSAAHAVTVPGPIPPHGSAAFSFRRPSPLPDRRDGQFVTDVEPVELTRRALTPSSYETSSDRTYERRTRTYEDRY